MNKKKKIILLAFVIIFSIICFCVANSNKTDNDDIKTNVTDNIENASIKIIQKVEGLEFSNVEIEKLSNGSCELRADVKNTTNEIIEAQRIKINVSNDENLNEIFGGQIASIMANEKIKLNATIRKDITSTTKVEFSISK